MHGRRFTEAQVAPAERAVRRQPGGAQRPAGWAAMSLSMVLTGRQPQVPSLLSWCLLTASQEFLAWWRGGEGGCEDKVTTGQRLSEQPSHKKL